MEGKSKQVELTDMQRCISTAALCLPLITDSRLDASRGSRLRREGCILSQSAGNDPNKKGRTLHFLGLTTSLVPPCQRPFQCQLHAGVGNSDAIIGGFRQCAEA
jgi:hypothetical protein